MGNIVLLDDLTINKIAEYSLHVGSLYQDIVLKLSPMTSFEY